MKIFLAGATGAMGKQLVPLLVGAGHEVVGTTRRDATRAAIEELGATPVVVDGLDADQVGRAVAAAEPDVIIDELTAIDSLDTFGPATVTTGSVATLIEGCTSSSFPTLIGGGYFTNPSAITNLAATGDGPSGTNDWEVDLVNNTGQSVAFTMYTVCTS